MSQNNPNKPLIRFKGFNDSWSETEINKLLIERNFQAPKCAKYPLMAFIADIGVSPKGERYDRSSLVLDEANKLYKRTELYDFIYSSNNLETGSIGLNKYGKASISPVYSIFKTTNIADPYFIGTRLVRRDFIKEMVKWRQGVVYGQWRIHEKDFLQLKINSPSLNEQKQIGIFFENLDNMIHMYEKRIDKLEHYKETLFNKVFPIGNDTKPLLRMKNFTSPWTSHKLGDIGKTFNSLSGKSKEDFGHGDAKYVTYLNVFNNVIADINGVDKIEIDNSQEKIKYGDVFFTMSSETPDEVGMASVWTHNTDNVYLNSFCFGYRLNKNVKIDPYFLGYSLRAFECRKQFIKLAQGISRYNISKNKSMEIVVSLPDDLNEQKSISSFLIELDNYIKLNIKKMDKLKKLKYSFMNRLFC